MATPHDRLFKDTFSELESARSQLAAVLPEAIASHLDWSTLALQSAEHHGHDGGALFSDLLYTAQLAGRQAGIYLLFEHQSTVDAQMPWRLLRYMVRIWERLAPKAGELLPVIVPVVLHHGPHGWTCSKQLRSLIDMPPGLEEALAPFIPDFTFVLDDLARLNDGALRERKLTELARMALLLLQLVRGSEDPVAILQGWTETLTAVLRGDDGRENIGRAGGYLLATTDVEAGHLRAFFATLGPGAEEAFMTGADRLRAEGRAEGQAAGRAAGQAEGQAALLLRLLGRRFGPIPTDAQVRVQQADTATLEQWGDRVLTAATLAEVLDGVG